MRYRTAQVKKEKIRRLAARMEAISVRAAFCVYLAKKAEWAYSRK